MKQFVTYLLVLIGIVVLFQFVGELVYTYVYNNGSYRNKVMWARTMDHDTPLDYAIIGNSISHYGIDPKQIEIGTGKKGLNFSYNAAHPNGMYLMFQTIIDRYPVSTVYIHLDHSYRTSLPDDLGKTPWMPYIKEDDVYNWYAPQGIEYRWYRMLPFYRYQKYEANLGFRNVLMSAVGKTPEFLIYDGFKPMHQGFARKNFDPFIIENTENLGIDAMVQLAKERQIELQFFTSPVYTFEGDYTVLKDRVPNYSNFSNRISDSTYFIDEIHLNANGARMFTEIFINHYFK